ncbi:hypothetical protein ACRALDRAFT_207296 [Sodiomyces alcalophilus JCM 7366]|uniref:uncharacterized protein n=1 Tax=Sodiomyces alcalophilus JCM 7366 TaxID=591952 RepID=UPI0039B5BCBF
MELGIRDPSSYFCDKSTRAVFFPLPYLCSSQCPDVDIRSAYLYYVRGVLSTLYTSTVHQPTIAVPAHAKRTMVYAMGRWGDGARKRRRGSWASSGIPQLDFVAGYHCSSWADLARWIEGFGFDLAATLCTYLQRTFCRISILTEGRSSLWLLPSPSEPFGGGNNSTLNSDPGGGQGKSMYIVLPSPSSDVYVVITSGWSLTWHLHRRRGPQIFTIMMGCQLGTRRSDIQPQYPGHGCQSLWKLRKETNSSTFIRSSSHPNDVLTVISMRCVLASCCTLYGIAPMAPMHTGRKSRFHRSFILHHTNMFRASHGVRRQSNICPDRLVTFRTPGSLVAAGPLSMQFEDPRLQCTWVEGSRFGILHYAVRPTNTELQRIAVRSSWPHRGRWTFRAPRPRAILRFDGSGVPHFGFGRLRDMPKRQMPEGEGKRLWKKPNVVSSCTGSGAYLPRICQVRSAAFCICLSRLSQCKLFSDELLSTSSFHRSGRTSKLPSHKHCIHLIFRQDIRTRPSMVFSCCKGTHVTSPSTGRAAISSCPLCLEAHSEAVRGRWDWFGIATLDRESEDVFLVGRVDYNLQGIHYVDVQRTYLRLLGPFRDRDTNSASARSGGVSSSLSLSLSHDPIEIKASRQRWEDEQDRSRLSISRSINDRIGLASPIHHSQFLAHFLSGPLQHTSSNSIGKRENCAFLRTSLKEEHGSGCVEKRNWTKESLKWTILSDVDETVLSTIRRKAPPNRQYLCLWKHQAHSTQCYEMAVNCVLQPINGCPYCAGMADLLPSLVGWPTRVSPRQSLHLSQGNGTSPQHAASLSATAATELDPQIDTLRRFYLRHSTRSFKGSGRQDFNAYRSAKSHKPSHADRRPIHRGGGFSGFPNVKTREKRLPPRRFCIPYAGWHSRNYMGKPQEVDDCFGHTNNTPLSEASHGMVVSRGPRPLPTARLLSRCSPFRYKTCSYFSISHVRHEERQAGTIPATRGHKISRDDFPGFLFSCQIVPLPCFASHAFLPKVMVVPHEEVSMAADKGPGKCDVTTYTGCGRVFVQLSCMTRVVAPTRVRLRFEDSPVFLLPSHDSTQSSSILAEAKEIRCLP